MIYFYYGEDTFRAKQTIDQLKEKFITLYDPAGHNIIELDPDSFSLEAFFNAAKSTGFLSTKKLLILKNIFSHKKFNDIQDLLIKFLKTQQNTKEENYLVFWHEGTPRQNAPLVRYLIKTCTPHRCCKNFELLAHENLLKWVQNYASNFGKRMSREAAELLISPIGNNTWHLAGEIRKLAFATPGEAIESTLIEQITNVHYTETIFPLLDALGKHRKRDALTLLEKALTSEHEHSYLLAMIIRQFRLLLQVQEFYGNLRNRYAVARSLRLPPFVVKKLLAQAEQFQRTDLIRNYQQLAALDRLLRLNPDNLKAALTLFVAQL